MLLTTTDQTVVIVLNKVRKNDKKQNGPVLSECNSWFCHPATSHVLLTLIYFIIMPFRISSKNLQASKVTLTCLYLSLALFFLIQLQYWLVIFINSTTNLIQLLNILVIYIVIPFIIWKSITVLCEVLSTCQSIRILSLSWEETWSGC